MAQVDPEDDSITRFIVRHYRYDPARRERRHVIVAAFDNEREFHSGMNRVTAEIAQRRDRGEHVDPGEHASGVVFDPGHLRRAAIGHLVSRAIEHGARLRFSEQDLPPNIAVFRAHGPTTHDLGDRDENDGVPN